MGTWARSIDWIRADQKAAANHLRVIGRILRGRLRRDRAPRSFRQTIRSCLPTRVLPLLVAFVFFAPNTLVLIPQSSASHAVCANGGCCVICKMGQKLGKKIGCHGEIRRAHGPVLSCATDNPSPASIDQPVDLRFVLASSFQVAHDVPYAHTYASLGHASVDDIDHRPPVPPPRSIVL